MDSEAAVPREVFVWIWLPGKTAPVADLTEIGRRCATRLHRDGARRDLPRALVDAEFGNPSLRISLVQALGSASSMTTANDSRSTLPGRRIVASALRTGQHRRQP